MKKNKQHNIGDIFQFICGLIEYCINRQTRCFIEYKFYREWSVKQLKVLQKATIIRKEDSKKLEFINCNCTDSPTLEIRYSQTRNAYFTQCIECGLIKNFNSQELELYETSPMIIATFFANCINDIDTPILLKENRLFFVGETSNDVSVYLVFGLKYVDNKELNQEIEQHSDGAKYIIISSFVSSRTKNKQILSLYDKDLYSYKDSCIGINIDYIEKLFAKNSKSQEAAKIRWQNDEQNKAIQTRHNGQSVWVDLGIVEQKFGHFSFSIFS